MDMLANEIAAYKAVAKEKVPDQIRAIMAQCTTEIKESGIESRALKAGDRMDIKAGTEHWARSANGVSYVCGSRK